MTSYRDDASAMALPGWTPIHMQYSEADNLTRFDREVRENTNI